MGGPHSILHVGERRLRGGLVHTHSSPLSREGHSDIINYLLDTSPNCWNTKSKNGRTPLHTVGEQYFSPCPSHLTLHSLHSFLLSAFMPSLLPSFPTSFTYTALQGRLEAAHILLTRGSCHSDCTDSCGVTPLMDAVRGDHVAMAELLLHQFGVSLRKPRE